MTTIAPQPDFNTIKERQQRMWGTGDYREVGSRLVLMSELLCEAADLRAGQRVLDVASGTGNAAIAAARRFCDVISTDYVPELLERGKVRAEAEGLPIRFEVADAENLPFDDASFDVVLSAIGAMFAPNQARCAGELLRVCRPGGKIGMTNWTPDGFVGSLFKTVAAYNPPPPGVQPPSVWGTEEGLHSLLGDGADLQHIQRRLNRFRSASPEALADFFITNFGPVRVAHTALDAAGQTSLRDDLRKLAAENNISGDDTLIMESGYLEVVAVRH